MLSTALEYFKNKYNFILLKECYICSKNIKLKNTEQLLNKINNIIRFQETEDIELLKTIDIDYRIWFIAKLINQQKPASEIIKYLELLNVNPNTVTYFLRQYSNLFHHIAYKSINNNYYFIELYDILNKKYGNQDLRNNFNLSVNDYFNYELNSFM